MILNTFAPPFRLVGGYFIVGLIFLLVSLAAFFWADFGALAALQTAGFLHIFLVGFAMSIIIGALYQLTSVILEKPFFSVKGAFLNLFIYAVGVMAFSVGLITGKMALMHAGGGILFISLVFFAITYLLSFIGNQKRSFAAFALLVSAIFLIVGIVLGFCLILVFSGALSVSFDLLLHYHIYFVLGFVFFIIVGVASVLLPMFALVHDLKFIASKFALALYMLAGGLIVISLNLALIALALAVICFVYEAAMILKRRVRKAFDYWNINIFLSLLAFIGAGVFFGVGRADIAVFWLIYGFLYAFIVAHLYKIAPFLIWYHYVSPFVGKGKVPLLDDMIVKMPTYVAICANALALMSYAFGVSYVALVLLAVSVILVAFNMAHVFKFTKFGVENER